MRRIPLCAIALLFIGAFAPAVSHADDLVPPDSKLELLYTRSAPIKGGLTEGVAAAPDGSMYFSEIPFGDDKGLIMRFDPRSKMTAIFARDSHKSNGLMFDAKGNLIACEGSDGGGRCVARWDVKTGRREVVADRYMGKRFNACNDLCIDEKGRIYFTDPRYLGTEPRELEYRAV
jgi:gluconolactonase